MQSADSGEGHPDQRVTHCTQEEEETRQTTLLPASSEGCLPVSRGQKLRGRSASYCGDKMKIQIPNDYLVLRMVR